MAGKEKKKDPSLKNRLEQSEKDMEKYFADCPRVAMRLYRNPDQEEGEINEYAEAAINGHVFLVQRGVTVTVPTPLYLLFKQAGERFDVE
jgi:hypothetical protein